jgi:lysophosphatidylcholine acyltransferase/lyso-PAF acetyltransferase
MTPPTLDVSNIRKSTNEAVELARTLPRPTNAFAYQGHIGLYENFKLLLGIVLVPIRVILAVILFALAAMFSQLSLWVGKPYGQPRGTLQSMFMVPVAYIMRIVLFVWGFYWIEVKGKKPKASEARMVAVASHSTMVDSLFIGYKFNMPAGISKAENKHLPLLGTVSVH